MPVNLNFLLNITRAFETFFKRGKGNKFWFIKLSSANSLENGPEGARLI